MDKKHKCHREGLVLLENNARIKLAEQIAVQFSRKIGNVGDDVRSSSRHNISLSVWQQNECIQHIVASSSTIFD